MRFLASVVDGFAKLGFLFLALSGVGLHLYTILITFEVHGFVFAALALMFPIIAEVLLTIESIVLSGLVFNPYSLAVFSYATYFIALMIITLLGWFVESKIAET